MKNGKPVSDKHEKEQRFYKAALELFQRYGYRKTSVVEICRTAGYSKPTFYSIFKDKSALFVKLIIDIAEADLREWESTLPPGLNPAEKLVRFLDFYDDVLAGKTIYQVMMEDQSIMKQFAWMMYSMPHSPILSTLHNILEEGIQKGYFRNCNPGTALWMIYALLDSMFILIPMLTRQKGAGEDPAIASEVKQFILRGMGYDEN